MVTGQLFDIPVDENNPARTEQRKADAERKRSDRAEGREINIPEVVNPKRRARAARDSKFFMTSYFSEFFDKPFSADHKVQIKQGTQIYKEGGLGAIGATRGDGKTTRAIVLLLHATLNGLVRFCPLLGKNGIEARENLETIKMILETNEKLAEDYPEVCYPFRSLEGVNQRAGMMMHNGELIHMKVTTHKIVLPTIKGSLCSGSVICCRGLDGAIRGMKHVTAAGEMLRPDAFMIDDPLDLETAQSASGNTKLLKKIKGDVMALGGPGKKIGGLILCTVIEEGDVADQILDRKAEPMFNGIRQRLIYAMPKDMELWNKYEQFVLEQLEENDECSDVSDCTKATSFYKKNKRKMDAGAKISWKERFIEGKELSAIQHAMNLRIKHGEEAFEAEFNNNPQRSEDSALTQVTPYLVQKKINGLKRGVVPDECEMLFIGADIGIKGAYWAALAMVKHEMIGYVIDYGFTEFQTPGSSRHPDKNSIEYKAIEKAIFDGLCQFRDQVEEEPYRNESGNPVELTYAMLDCRYMTSAIYSFCDISPRWFGCMGHGTAKKQSRWHVPKPGKECKVSNSLYAKKDSFGQWRFHQYSDKHKLQVHQGFLIPRNNPGSITLFGENMREHHSYSHHIANEQYVETTPGYFEWKPSRSGRAPNHWLDASALCYACASRFDLKIVDDNKGKRQQKKQQKKTEDTDSPAPAPQKPKKRRRRKARTYDI